MNEEFHALILTSHESENGVMMTGFDGTEVILVRMVIIQNKYSSHTIQRLLENASIRKYSNMAPL